MTTVRNAAVEQVGLARFQDTHLLAHRHLQLALDDIAALTGGMLQARFARVRVGFVNLVQDLQVERPGVADLAERHTSGAVADRTGGDLRGEIDQRFRLEKRTRRQLPFRLEEVGHADAESAKNLAQGADRRADLILLDVGNLRVRHAGALGQLALGHGRRRPHRLETGADIELRLQVFLAPFRRSWTPTFRALRCLDNRNQPDSSTPAVSPVQSNTYPIGSTL
jgi:hypothetical protein